MLTCFCITILPLKYFSKLFSHCNINLSWIAIEGCKKKSLKSPQETSHEDLINLDKTKTELMILRKILFLYQLPLSCVSSFLFFSSYLKILVSYSAHHVYSAFPAYLLLRLCALLWLTNKTWQLNVINKVRLFGQSLS